MNILKSKVLLSTIATPLAFFSVLTFTNKALADIKLTTGEPEKAGLIRARVTFGDGSITEVEVNVPEGTTSVGKAILLQNAFLNPPNIPNPNGPGQIKQRGIQTQRMGNMLTFPGNIDVFEKIRDTTGETTRLEAVNRQKAKEGQIDGSFIEIASSLSGLDSSGNESEFVASLGFETPSENVSVSSQFLFSDLGGNDIDDWLSTIFIDIQQQLPTIYQSDLSLDLINDEISFVFPENILLGSGFIANGSNDLNVSSSLDIEVEKIPEPTFTLSFLALGTLGAASTLKRKLKSSKSSEKELEKVS
ncbi:hypothetical protein [Okeania sp. SIO2B3]|uniref:hypothetical protein n=1 Tax=Okeania sp. SIO2B3 TaxID=2607784 RepID=UPI0013C19753|nr:hypothetical protein [Okeania sp. SIO2B3]NET44749.1 PEP-CTERM sorting domain-containing protein [Okeania sp. SIO2B3]